MDDLEALRAAVRAWSEKERRALEEHPSPEELLDYHLGDLPEEERERLEDHLAVCADCARTVLALGAFPEVEPEGGSGAPADAEWERLRRRAFPGRRAAAVQPRGWRPAYALMAASLLVAAFGGYWAGRQSQPAQDVVVANLLPIEEVRGEAEGEKVVRVPRGTDVVVLNLAASAEPESRPEYEVELVDAEGNVVWSRDGLRANADGEVAVSLPRLPGTYGIRLHGVQEGPGTLEEYAAKIEYE